MKSGSEIYVKLLDHEEPEKGVRKLSNGSLRSLMTALKKPKTLPPDEKGRLIFGLAMVEASERWLKRKGERKIL